MFTRYFITAVGIILCRLSCSYAVAEVPLEMLIAQALENNPTLQALTSQLQAAAADQRAARAAYYPQLGAAVHAMRTDNAPQAFMLQLNQRQLDMRDAAFDPNHPDDTNNIQLSLGIQYPILDGTRGPQRKISALHETLAREKIKAARNAMAHAVTRGYYQVLASRAYAAVQDAALASFSESLRVAQERYESGAVVHTDVLNLEVQLAQASENQIRARNRIALALAALQALIGNVKITAEDLQEPESDLTALAMHDVTIDARAELTMRRLQRELAAQQTRLARTRKRPMLHAFGSVIWDSEDLDNQEQSYIAGVALEWNWFDGGLTRARVDSARAMQAAATAHMQETELQLQLDAQQAALQLQEAWERIHVTKRAVTSATEALRITRALYQEGATEVANLLVAESALTETRMRAAAARYDYLIAQSNAKRAAGTLVRTLSNHIEGNGSNIE